MILLEAKDPAVEEMKTLGKADSCFATPAEALDELWHFRLADIASGPLQAAQFSSIFGI